MSRRDFTLNDIHLALDGELPADDRADFEHWLDAHADMKALSARYERDRAVLVAALAPVLDEPVPAELEKHASGEREAAPFLARVLLRSAAAAAVLLRCRRRGRLSAASAAPIWPSRRPRISSSTTPSSPMRPMRPTSCMPSRSAAATEGLSRRLAVEARSA